MPELGQTSDPVALVPGNPATLHESAYSMSIDADVLADAGAGLRRISTPQGWSGRAADEFHAAFAVQPQRWSEAAQCHRSAADAVESYATTLAWAQRQAAEAIRLWDDAQPASERARAEYDQVAATPLPPGAPPTPPLVDPGETARHQAVALLDDARSQLGAAGDRAMSVVGAARDRAPEGPGFWSDLASGAGTVAAEAGNITASLGNAALNHPFDVAAMAGGVALASVSALGFAGGLALDATGVGAVGGVPLGAASAAGIATGVGLAGAGAIDLALNAAGPDRVQPFQANTDVDPSAEATPTAEPPREITGFTRHGEEQAMGRDGGAGVSDEALADAVEQPVKEVREQAGGRFKFTGKDAIVVLNENGEVITAWARGRRAWRPDE